MHKHVVLVTGGSGFVGSALIDQLVERPNVGEVRNLLRREPSSASPARCFVVPDFDLHSDFSACLEGVDIVIHCAGRVPDGDMKQYEALQAYRLANVELTSAIARQANLLGVRRFVFLSSTKVNGNLTVEGKPFREEDVSAASDVYAQSKLEAEDSLREIVKAGRMEACIVRAPLIYGPGAKANFESLVKLIRTGLPIPFGAAKSRRSFIAINNLVDFLITCATHLNAANQTLLVSDDEDVSTAELCDAISRAVGRRQSTLAIPLPLMRMLLALAGKGQMASSLFDPMQIDISKARRMLGWEPVSSMAQQLSEMVDSDQ